MRPGYVGQEVMLDGTYADTIHYDVLIPAVGHEGLQMTEATVSVNGVEIPVKPGAITVEVPFPSREVYGSLPPVSVEPEPPYMDVTIRLRCRPGGVTGRYLRRDPEVFR